MNIIIGIIAIGVSLQALCLLGELIGIELHPPQNPQ